MFSPATMAGTAIAGMTSAMGRSHTFDKRADGYARGETVLAFACRLVDVGPNNFLFSDVLDLRCVQIYEKTSFPFLLVIEGRRFR